MELLLSYGPSAFWLIALIVFLVVEALTVGLTSIWFAAGALAALISSFATGNLWIQAINFLVVSLIALAAVRPLVKKYMVPQQQATNADRAIGAEGLVTEEIRNAEARGQVSVNGAVWTARSEEEDCISKGERVRVLRIEGVKLIVTPMEPAPSSEQNEEE